MDINRYGQFKDQLEPSKQYHIYNRAVGDSLLFRTHSDYYYFLEKLKRFLKGIGNLLAYSLLPNHFHLLFAIEAEAKLPIEITSAKSVSNAISNQFGNLFNSYSRSYNRAHNRHGKLFEQQFSRKQIKDDFQLIQTIYYIHRNPVHHNLSATMSDWKYSSYNEIVQENSSIVDYQETINFFGGKDKFIFAHDLHLKEFLQQKKQR